MWIHKAYFSLAAFALLLLAAGCEDEPTATKPRIKARQTIGKYTQNVRPAAPELQNGAREAPKKITAKDPITLPGNAYVVSMNKIAYNNVKHAIDLYQAEHGNYPRNFQEFTDEILKPNQPDGIRLPQLPYYQDYGYDEQKHELIVLEYPDRKARFQEQQDRDLGRR